MYPAKKSTPDPPAALNFNVYLELLSYQQIVSKHVTLQFQLLNWRWGWVVVVFPLEIRSFDVQNVGIHFLTQNHVPFTSMIEMLSVMFSSVLQGNPTCRSRHPQLILAAEALKTLWLQ